jgi:multiple sugar transport system ATP-binding protein
MNVTGATVRPAEGRTSVVIGDGDGAFDFPAELGQRLAAAPAEDRDVMVGVRPEAVLVSRQEAPGYVPVEAHIIEPLGAYDIVDLKVGGQFIRARTSSGYVGRAGDTVWAKLDEAQTHFFSARSGEALDLRPGQ